ncbi:MAG: flagellin lysine-N-methylase [Oscillospiraceae bacterium]|nr:flagellin lysine-N-methylase [Oscillospiraceae bacterium]
MQISKPCYFDAFTCLASACPDSCCKEWDVAVDEQSARYYRTLSGDLGQRLRQVLTEEDGQVYMTIEDGRCPMWRKDGLCRIQAELGHDALCKTCREFPRLTHDYGGFTELGLELSCPEAARLILSSLTAPLPLPELSDCEDYDREDMELLLQTRQEAFALLEREDFTVPQALSLLLLYGYHAQSLLDGEDAPAFSPEAALDTAKEVARPGSREAIRAFFLSLEILTPGWKQRLNTAACPGDWTEQYRLLAKYFVQRYWLQAISDFDLVSRVKLAVILCILIRDLGGDLCQTAQLCSKEIENNTDNVDALLDAAYTCPALTDDKLLWLLLLG